jgi:ABC-type maltose transport system permease subunit
LGEKPFDTSNTRATMANKKQQHSLESLEIERLKLLIRRAELELELSDQWKHLRTNYGKIALNSIIPQEAQFMKGVANSFADGNFTDMAATFLANPKTYSFAKGSFWTIAQFILFKLVISWVKNAFSSKSTRYDAVYQKLNDIENELNELSK